MNRSTRLRSKPQYLEALHLVERLHRRLLDVIKDEFERRGRDDVNSVQALLLYNIGDKELTASELRTRGYYLGLERLLQRQEARRDGLSPPRPLAGRPPLGAHQPDRQGPAGARRHQGALRQARPTIEPIGGISADDFQRLNQALVRLERFWTDQIRYRL